jgi:hypothetical protein
VISTSTSIGSAASAPPQAAYNPPCGTTGTLSALLNTQQDCRRISRKSFTYHHRESFLMIRETFVLVAVLAIATIANCQQVSINTTTEPATGTPVSNHTNGVPSTGSNPPASSPLIVTPAELDNQLQIFSAVYNASSLVRYYCNKSDYLVRLFACMQLVKCPLSALQYCISLLLSRGWFSVKDVVLGWLTSWTFLRVNFI